MASGYDKRIQLYRHNTTIMTTIVHRTIDIDMIDAYRYHSIDIGDDRDIDAHASRFEKRRQRRIPVPVGGFHSQTGISLVPVATFLADVIDTDKVGYKIHI